MKKIFYGFAMGCLFIANIAFAKLSIEITDGELAGIPIAITSSERDQGFEDLAQVIRSDLKMCGRFDPLHPDRLPHYLTAQQEAFMGTWQSLGAENVVLGSVTPTGNDRYSVNFKLVDVYKNGSVLAAQTFYGIRSQDFRALSHHISDIIYEKITGIKGAFSTRIAYVMVVKTPDGKRYSLEVADADGYNPQTLVKSREPIMSPSWSPDGRRMTFVSFEKNRAEVYLIDISTGRRELLSKFPGINGAPAWSPDGRTLALVLSKEGSPKIYLMDIQSRKLTQITEGYSIDTEPAWSIDGRNLYFTSNRGGKPQIYRLDVASRQIDRITFEGSYNARPMLTPDGRYLIMMHRGEQTTGVFNIASQDLQTGKVSVLTHAYLDESPTLSPNGAMVLYGTQDGDRQILGLVTLDGRGQLKLPAREGSVQEPAWSPFLS